MIEPQFPPPDPERASRIIKDVIELMQLSNDEATRNKVNRWLELTLYKACGMNRLPWWFARRLFACKIYEGQDVFDLQEGIDKLIGLYCPEKLQLKPIGFIIEQRSEWAYTYNHGNPDCYALYGGQIHLWPAPKEETLFIISYAQPVKIEQVPPEWEGCLLDGVIGFYGQYFDRSGLLKTPEDFTQRFIAGIKASRNEHFDTEAYHRYHHAEIRKGGLTSFLAYAETSMVDYENAIIKPAYSDAPGKVQILADKEQDNQRGVPFAQIPGDQQ